MLKLLARSFLRLSGWEAEGGKRRHPVREEAGQWGLGGLFFMRGKGGVIPIMAVEILCGRANRKTPARRATPRPPSPRHACSSAVVV